MAITLKPDIKRRWIEALLSGRYTQGQWYLVKHTSAWDDQPESTQYCCLGVLCDLAAQDGVVPEYVVHGTSSDYLPWQASQGHQLPCRAVVEWAATPARPALQDVDQGSPSADWLVPGDIDGVSLHSLNDNGATFQEIARLIEDHF